MSMACECVEIRVYWGAWQLHTAYVPHGQRYVVGEGPAVDLPVSAEQLGVSRLVLVNARGEVTLLQDGEMGRPQRLSPGERQSMSCGMLRFEVAGSTLPRMSLSQRMRRGAQRMLPLLLAAVAVLVALPLALGHELTPPRDEPTEEQRAYILARLPGELAQDDDAQNTNTWRAMRLLPHITIKDIPNLQVPLTEAERARLDALENSDPPYGIPSFLGQSHNNPLEESLRWPVTRYSLIELLHSGPPGAPIAQASPLDTWGACSCEIRNQLHECGGSHALERLIEQGGQPGIIDWDAPTWPPRWSERLSGRGIGENPAGRGRVTLATLHAPEQWQLANETRYHACMLAADCRGDAASHDRCLAEASASTSTGGTRTAQRDCVLNFCG